MGIIWFSALSQDTGTKIEEVNGIKKRYRLVNGGWQLQSTTSSPCGVRNRSRSRSNIRSRRRSPKRRRRRRRRRSGSRRSLARRRRRPQPSSRTTPTNSIRQTPMYTSVFSGGSSLCVIS